MEVPKANSILVTGSSRGIGLELVRQLAEHKDGPQWIFATCRDPEGPNAQNLRDLAFCHREVEIVPLGFDVAPVDVCEASSIKAAATRVAELLNGAGLNLLINNAGVAKAFSTLESETPEDMLEVYKTNVVGPMLVSQAFLPLLRKASQERPRKGMSCGKAAIVNLSSRYGSITNVTLPTGRRAISYHCSKAALNMLTKCQSMGFAKNEILCLAMHPGEVQTDMGNVVRLAPMTVDYSVKELLKTLARLSENHTGQFMDLEGKRLPW